MYAMDTRYSNSLPVLAGLINTAFDAVDSASLPARINVGRLLLQAWDNFNGTRSEGPWTGWCRDNIDRSYGDIKKCMALARAPDPHAALLAEREARRVSMAKSAAKKAAKAAADDGSQLGAVAPPRAGAVPVIHVARNKKGIPLEAFPPHVREQIAKAVAGEAESTPEIAPSKSSGDQVREVVGRIKSRKAEAELAELGEKLDAIKKVRDALAAEVSALREAAGDTAKKLAEAEADKTRLLGMIEEVNEAARQLDKETRAEIKELRAEVKKLRARKAA